MWRRRCFPIWILLAAIGVLFPPAGAQTAPAISSAGGAWIFEGPAPIQDPNFGALGGKVTALAATNNGMLAGTLGGVWKWSSGSWQPLTDSQPSLAISALALDPSSGRYYAGTGDPTLRDGGQSAIGLLFSDDGGNTWQATNSLPAGLTVTAIWIDPDNSSHLVVSTVAPSTKLGGIYNSTDGGASLDLGAAGQAWSLAYDSHLAKFVAGIGAAIEVWSSGGAPTIVPPVAGAAQYFVAVNPAAPGAVALAVDASGHCLGIARSSDDENWPATAILPCPTAQLQTLAPPAAVAFDAGGTLWLAGQDVWKYINGAWQEAASGPIAAPGQIHALQFVGGNAWLGGDGGVWELPAMSPAANWIDVNGGSGGTALGAVALSAAAASGSGLVAAASAPSGILARAGGLTWNSVAGSAGATVSVAPSDPDTVYAGLPAAAGLWVSTDGGLSYISRTWFAGAGPSFADPSLAPARAVIAVDPGVASHLYWATDRLWQSSDGGQTWAAPALAAPAGAVYTALAIAPQNPTVLYLGTSAGRVLRGDGSEADTGLPAAPITTLAVDPDLSPAAAASAPDTLIAGFGCATGGLYLSTDGGVTWVNIGAGIPALPVVSALMDPVDPNVVYVALARGVYASPDRGVTWYRVGTGLPNTPLADLRIASLDGARQLLAATAGRGAWTVPLAAAADPVTAVAGNAQSAVVGQALAQPLVAAAHNAFGLPLAGITVNWSDGGAGGTFSSPQAVTDATGQATTIYTLPSKAGLVSVTAASSGSAANFSATAVAGSAAAVVALSGGGQIGVTGAPLPQPAVALVTDRYNNPVSGVTVAFSDGGAGGSFSPASGVSSAQGEVSTQYTVPATPGSVTLSAAVAGLPPASFSESAQIAPDFSLTLSPNSQSADVDANASFQLATSAPPGETRVINLTCLSPPTGCSVMPGSLSPGGTATITVSTASFSLGANAITIQGSDGQHTHQVGATVNVLTPDFGVTLSAASARVNQVSANTFTVATTAINGDYHLLSLTCVAPASGCAFTPAQVAPGQTAALAIAAKTLSPGPQTVVIQASDGTMTHTASLALTVVPPGLALALTTPAQTLSAGQAASDTVAITPMGGFTGPVLLTCGGLPKYAACNFQPSSWNSDGSSAGSVALTVATTANAALPAPGPFNPWIGLLAFAAVALCGLERCGHCPLRSRVRLAMLLALALAGAACGGGAGAPLPHSAAVTGTPAGTYTITVAATSGVVSGQTKLILTVN
ncbi:MAG: hypothetical protein ACRD2H_02265 [Terriglobales bacterium]